jgi:hypothetical protein
MDHTALEGCSPHNLRTLHAAVTWRPLDYHSAGHKPVIALPWERSREPEEPVIGTPSSH